MENFVNNQLKPTFHHFVRIFPTVDINTRHRLYSLLKFIKKLDILVIDFLLINPTYYY
jgi:hypothetical protein